MQKYVEIKRDGLTLRGMLHVPDNVSSKVPMVILLHGFCDDRNGESDGRFENMTISSEILDAKAMLNYVESLDFVDSKKIAIHGCSLGGCVASMVAGQCKEKIKAMS